MGEKVSVIVPVYNVEEYIDRSIKSIINQSYGNIEIILIDDGSTDRSGIICDAYATCDDRIIVLHKANGGQGSARNMGLCVCTGQYIMFLDSDDYLELDCIQELVNRIESGNFDISVCNYYFVTEEGNVISRFTDTSDSIFNGYEVIEHMWNDEIINIAPWAKLYKRYLWENFRFEECYCEDSATMYKLYKKEMNICFTSRPLVNYVMRSSSDVRSFSEKKLHMIEIYDDVVKYAKTKLPNNLYKAAVSKTVAVNFHVLSQVPKGMYKEYTERMKNNIIKYRLKVIFDSQARKKNRIACMISYFGIDNTVKLLNRIKRNI